MSTKCKRFTSVVVIVSLVVSLLWVKDTTYVQAAESSNLTGKQRVSVHDPSIVVNTNPAPGDSKYYVFGSHITGAGSNDLKNWTPLQTAEYETPDNNWLFGDIQNNLAESFQWAGYDDGDCAGGKYAVWAPDVFWNANYVNEDSTKGAYMMYYSASSTWRRSCIGYAVSKNIEGPYTYVDTVVYSGFTTSGATDGNSTRNTRWDNSYLNLKELEDKQVIDVEETGNWFNPDGSYNHNYAPNAIDPTIFYNEDESKLYMVYGSWSGGIFLLELDQQTGEVIYPGADGVTPDGNVIDQYFGTRLCGGNHQSGEGPFIVYDIATDYYYLYVTYGGLAADGGYNMRLFRSKNPDGPYVDAAGNKATDNKNNNEQYGIKLIGNYQLYGQTIGYRAGGHNSSFIDTDGQMYLLYHSRFNFNNGGSEAYPWGTGNHELRVHQMFANQEGWPVTAPYEYSGDQIGHYSENSVVGTYEFINHGITTGKTMLSTQIIELNQDYTVSGELTGSWSKSTDASKDYDYITLDIGGTTYKGVFLEQQSETTNPTKVMTFTAVGDDNTCVWGSKLDFTDQVAVDRIANTLQESVPAAAKENITLPTSASGDVAISWSSNMPEIISNSGVVNRTTTDKTVSMTATLTKGTALITKDFNILVEGLPYVDVLTIEPIYKYNFSVVSGAAITSQGTITEQADASLIGAASVVEDSQRGEVLHVINGPSAIMVNYLKLPESTFSQVNEKGFTVGMWVNIAGLAMSQGDTGNGTWIHSALFEANGGGSGKFPLTRIGANLLARINSIDYADTNAPDQGLVPGQWQYVTYTVSQAGINVYLDGLEVVSAEKNIAGCFNATDGNIFFRGATDVRVGSGNIWNDEDVKDVKFDNVTIFNQALTEAEIDALYRSETGVVPTPTVEPTTEPSSTPDPTVIPTVQPTAQPTTPTTPSTPTPSITPIPSVTPTPVPTPVVTVDDKKGTKTETTTIADSITGAVIVKKDVTNKAGKITSSAQVTTKLSDSKTEQSVFTGKVQVPSALSDYITDNRKTSILLPSASLIEQLQTAGVQKVDLIVTIPNSVLNKINIQSINIDRSVLQAAIDQKKKIVVSIKDDTGVLLYHWTFDGSKVKKIEEKSDVNLFVKMVTAILNKVVVSISDSKLGIGEKVNLNLGIPEGTDYSVSYQSSNANVASITKNGIITAKGKGTAVVTTTIKIKGITKKFKTNLL